MRRRKVITNYSQLRLDELHTLAGTVVDCMKNNPTFAGLPVSLEELEAVAIDFQKKWERLKDDGGKTNKIRRDYARDALFDVFSRLATFVNQLAKGDMEILLQSGFYLDKVPTALGAPSKPIFLEMVDGPQRNQLSVRFPSVKKAYLYEYQYADEVDIRGLPIWREIIVVDKPAGVIILDTLPTRIYYVRARTRNKAGCSDWSDIVSLMAR